jgi:hypothetical protein
VLALVPFEVGGHGQITEGSRVSFEDGRNGRDGMEGKGNAEKEEKMKEREE